MSGRRLALSVLSMLLLGCSTAGPATPAPGGDDEAAIRRLEEEERLGVLRRDLSVLQRVWSERLVVNTPSNQISSDREVVLDLMRRGLIDYARFERRIERLRIDGDIAFVMGGETIEAIGNSPQAGQTVQRRFTHVWKKEAGTWRLVARHANIMARP